MSALPLPFFSRTRPSALALTVALHVALLLLWRLTQTTHHPASLSDADSPAIAWIKAVTRPLPRPVPPPAPPKTTSRKPSEAPAATAPAVPAAVPAPEPAAPAPAAVAAPNAGQVLQQALHDVGKIDQELRKSSPGGRFVARTVSPATKLVEGIEKATRAPRLWEAPRIESVGDQWGTDRRIYKVTSANGVYCIYKESNHALDGRDVIKNGVGEKLMSCPREE